MIKYNIINHKLSNLTTRLSSIESQPKKYVVVVVVVVVVAVVFVVLIIVGKKT